MKILKMVLSKNWGIRFICSILGLFFCFLVCFLLFSKEIEKEYQAIYIFDHNGELVEAYIGEYEISRTPEYVMFEDRSGDFFVKSNSQYNIVIDAMTQDEYDYIKKEIKRYGLFIF